MSDVVKVVPSLYAGWSWEIKTPKQDNGLWGMPMRCFKMDRMPYEISEVKHSAICIGIAEAYMYETFEIFWSDKDGFYVKLSESGTKRIRYSDYTLTDNTLTWVG